MELKRKSKKSINRGVVFMQKNKKRAYPAFIREDEGMQLVYVPDFAIFTEGHDLVDAIEMARDAIGMTGKAYEEDGKELPEPSDYEEAITRAELIKVISIIRRAILPWLMWIFNYLTELNWST